MEKWKRRIGDIDALWACIRIFYKYIPIRESNIENISFERYFAMFPPRQLF